MFDLMEEHEFGPAPRFTTVHLWLALDSIREHGSVSRKTLTELVGVGEGSIRTILSIFTKNKLVRISQTGARITKKGKGALESVPIQMARIETGDLTLGRFDFAVLVKGAGDRIGSGIEQRDAAIKVGALGATTIVFSKGKLMMPDSFDVEAKYPDVGSTLRRKFGLEENDVIIIGTSEDEHKAKEGALAAAFELMESSE